MHKLIRQLIVIGTGVSLIACSTGSSGSGSSNTAPTITQLTIPPGFSADVSLGNDTSVLYSDTLKEIAVPNNQEYLGYILPDEVNAAITAAGVGNVKVFYSPAGIALLTSTDAYLLYYPTSSSSAQGVKQIAFGGWVVVSIVAVPAVVVGIVIASNDDDNDDRGQLVTGTMVSTIKKTGEHTAELVPASTTGCAIAENDEIVINSTANFDSRNYYGIGTESGVVCVQEESKTWNTLSTQAPTGNSGNKYTPGKINQFGFYGSGTQLLGYWQVANSESSLNTIYQVNGTFTSPDSYTPTAFWNMSTNGSQQNSSKTNTININGAPAVIVSSVTDKNGTLYVGSNNGFVYKLTANQSPNNIAWTATQVMANNENYTGNVVLRPNENNTGATAVLPGGQGFFAVN